PSGGGLSLYSIDTQPLVIENSTITGNQATAGSGGGIYLYDLYSGMTLNFTTIASNTASTDGGGVEIGSGDGTISNSIIADNTAPANADLGACACSTFDVSFTLIEAPTTATINNGGGNLTGVDPQLAPPANNGGPTQTQRPALTSPVVNAADPATTVLTDQRGQPREYPVRADMGALELVGGVIQFNPQTYTVAENAGSVTLTVVRDVGPDPATVQYTTNPGTATAGPGNDYTTAAGTLTFLPGDLSETFNVTILDDAAIEGSEQFTATLSNPSADATVGAANPATVTITDFEAGQFVFSNATYSVNETGGSILITVNRINGSNGAASVNYQTTSGSATAGADFTTTVGTLNWADGDATPKTFSVPILDDSLAEGNENFTVSLFNPGGATIGVPGTSTVTIVDDPAGTAQFSVSTINTTEEAGSVVVTVTRTGGTEGALVVNYATANGTATAPSDYVPAAGAITFPAGNSTPQTFTITLVNDNLNEGQEMFTANLTGPGVGSPSSVSIVLDASDLEAVPTLSFFGKILFGIMSAIVGLYAVVRNRFTVMLLGLLLIGLVAAPPLSAQQRLRQGQRANAAHEKEKKDS
ncbi:MAG TPA: Calx-beta domain-containing protein, partial [Thermoanaerobaculia bacterium]|nr:Calx-beta domain-containing protein [Thermoanaerobaculia bacterium]